MSGILRTFLLATAGVLALTGGHLMILIFVVGGLAASLLREGHMEAKLEAAEMRLGIRRK